MMRRLAIPALVAWLAATPVRADDDGGTTSVFAYGAGNRALAMGGAFSSIADDASAPAWNPAGLALLQQPEFQGSQASLYGFDIGEQYGAVALPSWRFGTAAFVFRRFAIDGIEHRDDRNVLLGTLQDAQTEFMLSYGRTMASTWSVGASIKAQRQSLAGYSDSGLGFDAGAILKPGLAFRPYAAWAQRLNLGLTIRNLVEPSIRLVEESVPDPTTVRVGLSYAQPYAGLPTGPGSLLFAFDMEKTKARSAIPHAGAEWSVHPLLSLRGGVHGSDPRFGAGIRWHGASFDYVYEDNVLEPVHRFGASYVFGATLTERRESALAAEEERFRNQLTHTFEQREQARVAELLDRAETLVRSDRPDEALEVLTTALALDPESERARDLEIRALLAQAAALETQEEFASAAIVYSRILSSRPDHFDANAGLTRCRTESDQRAERTTKIRELFATALDAFTGGDLRGARDGFRGVLELAPDDTEARAMLRRTETAIDVRVKSLLGQAERFLSRSLLSDAEEALHQARLLDPNANGYAALSARLRKAEEELANASRTQTPRVADAAPRAVPKAPALSRKKREELAELYRSGITAMEENRADLALQYWELVWLSDPTYQNVAEYLKREYLLRGLDSFSQGGLDEAVRLWEKALQVDPTDEKTLSYLARAREQQSRTREILRTKE
jgi:tetratricopeptide (TPR) repeat protein